MDKPDDVILTPAALPFETLKQRNSQGVEYWSARDLQPCLGYTEWRKFKNAIKKLKSSEGGFPRIFLLLSTSRKWKSA